MKPSGSRDVLPRGHVVESIDVPMSADDFGRYLREIAEAARRESDSTAWPWSPVHVRSDVLEALWSEWNMMRVREDAIEGVSR